MIDRTTAVKANPRIHRWNGYVNVKYEMSLWNCGSLMPKSCPFSHNNQVRHLPAAEEPAAIPISSRTTAKAHRWKGSAAVRMRSRLSCSGEVGRNEGRNRKAT